MIPKDIANSSTTTDCLNSKSFCFLHTVLGWGPFNELLKNQIANKQNHPEKISYLL
jgi:hypothetical protein